MTATKILRPVIVIAVLAALGILLWFATRPPPLVVQGEVSANRVDISPRVSGRIAKLIVDVGDNVEASTVIAELESPELTAALHMAQAALAVSEADLTRVNSTRPETIDAANAELAAATADVTLYQEESTRQARLITTGASTQAQVDQTARNLEAAIRKRESAEANVRLAVAGSSKEEKALAAAQVEQARASLNQQQVNVSELTIHAPISGQVTTRVAELGENFSAGAPLFSIIDIRNPWFTFNLREDLLKGLKIDDGFDIVVPAIGPDRIAVKVTMINTQGQYATWRATRATGDFDLRTFEVRAVPVKSVDGLRPGMSAIAAWSER
ncbi:MULTISPECIES: HlyD family secretion protein [unclassified Rhizobium]|uniref:HlyD family secretion protein n=1 Tax=unclassified Rhizobium TaxID=2613769 RepID=UPI001C83296C|nr:MULTISPECIES: efflux RND transporter periplasmic adaptor subunit [unclassified Rhizobium]MBX5164233.1 biotin/lipoyl-binding protein [Rhizobium sp. NZLR4b]MBX5192766.1 biotin/lipoyl-binding protein [Rhizobium sp. NZLR3b]MBX5201787.1 biotin/lipoyl-binding protein [Rhizobium sp. NZLR1]MBX5208223.1 biotin/lipoyl-binding protein [Rhizobium sp. NZLR11]